MLKKTTSMLVRFMFLYRSNFGKVLLIILVSKSLMSLSGKFSLPKKTILTFGCLDKILINSKPT